MTSATPKPRAGERERDDEAWMHGACLTIAETGQKWGENVHPSAAMRAVFKLRAEHDNLVEALAGMVAIEDSTTQGYERELRTKWLPIARALLAKVRP